ncbi:hypothetical protein [Pseudonocardia sp. GCM10023141]|uniref:hypothetical protein n=1 Tax=Pseudonocardia sp. GCM10023141 TaxID=3252653 RepID=UPI00361FD063
MLGMQLAALQAGPPAHLDEALAAVTGFDDALEHGFARLGPQRGAALDALAAATAGTALGPAAAEAAAKVAVGTPADTHLAALAGARTALFGAAHDALLERLDAALGRERAVAAPAPTPAPAPEGEHLLLGGCRAWLHEVATAGWRGVDHDLVAASEQVVAALLAAPARRRLGVLIDGLAAELRACSPVVAMDEVPARRWADLWARALLLAHAPVAPESAATVSGRLFVLGVDVHEHATAVQVQVHAVLDGNGPPRLVRASIAAAKVDTIVGPAVWRLLQRFPVLLAALAQHRSATLTDMPLLPSGDLLWQEQRAALGEPAEPFTTARVLLPDATATAAPPLDRHPVGIAEPVLVEGYTAAPATDSPATDSPPTLTLDRSTIEIDMSRLPTCGPLTPGLVTASSACLGLLRWDGRWLLQPLAVQATVKRKPVEAHTGDWALGPTDPKVVKAEARAGDAVAVLRERAGRLLR